MYGISAAFTAALAGSPQRVFRAEILQNELITYAGLEVVSGGVTVDRQARIRREANLRLADSTGLLTPTDANDLLHPASGSEVRLWHGLRLDDGTEEYVPVGTFRIVAPKVTRGPRGLQIELQGKDRARTVQRARFTDFYRVPSGTNYATAISNILTSRIPTITTSFTTVTYQTGELLFEAGDDPWEAAVDMAQAVGMELYVDPLGVFVLRPEPNPAGDPVVARYTEGTGGGLLAIQKILDDEGTYNHTIVTGEKTENTVPVRAEALDINPSSPTYVYGPYGDVPTFFVSKMVTTTAQAQAAADALLRRKLATLETVDAAVVANPAHEGGDVVYLESARLGVADNYVTDRFELPFGPGPAALSSRRSV